MARTLRASGATLAFLSTTALAQTPPAALPSDNGGLEEVIVTARRQSENLQRTPLAITALTAAALENANIRGINKVAELVPNVSMEEASGTIGGTQPFIRGIGTAEPLLTVDSPVGTYLDGVYLGRQAASNFDLADPERIEVLRGPQGTLFGRNTTGGAISIISRAPMDHMGGTVKAGYSSFDDWYVRGSLDSGAIGKSGLSATVAGIHRERGPLVDNPGVPDKRSSGAIQSTAFYGKVHGDWDRLRMNLAADWSRQTGVLLPFEITRAYEPQLTYFSQSPSYGGDPFVTGPKLNQPLPREDVGRQLSKVFGFSGTFEYDLSDAIQLKSISAWRGWNAKSPTGYAGNLRGPAVDFTSPTFYSIQRVTPFVAYDQDLRQRQFSQEVQILGRIDTLKYVAGLYYFNERGSEFNTNNFTIVLPPAFLGALGFPAAIGNVIAANGIGLVGVNLGQTLQYATKSESKAAFGQVSWKPHILNDRLELTGGLRYTKDKRLLDQQSVAVAGLISGTLPNPPFIFGPSRTGRENFDNWSYLASVNFQWTPQIMTYGRISTGYKSGGFDARAGVDLNGNSFNFAFKPEKATSYELGFKAQTANRRLRVNADVFLTRYNDLQVSQYAGGQGFVPNADATYKGVELDIEARPVSSLQLDASLGYTDPTYRKFIIPLDGVTADYKSLARFPYVPKFTAHTGAQYTIPLDWASLILRGDYSRQSKRYFFTFLALNPYNAVIADPGQDLVSARITLSDIKLGTGKTLQVSVFGENLLSRRYRTTGIDFGPSIGIAGNLLGEPRRLGVEAAIKF